MGDVTFTLQAEDGYKPFALCESAVLIEELAHRESLRSHECTGRQKTILFWTLSVAILITGFCVYAAFMLEIPTKFVVGLSMAGFLIGLVQIIRENGPSPFEIRQIGAIQEIRDILRERG